MRKEHPVIAKKETYAQRFADTVSALVGSWVYVLSFILISAIWMIYNGVNRSSFDPYPYILLNLVYAIQSVLTSTFIMMSANRQTEKDKQFAEYDHEINIETKQEIEALQQSIAGIEEQITSLNEMVVVIQKVLIKAAPILEPMTREATVQKRRDR